MSRVTSLLKASSRNAEPVLAALVMLLRFPGEVGHGQGPLHVVGVDLRRVCLDALDGLREFQNDSAD